MEALLLSCVDDDCCFSSSLMDNHNMCNCLPQVCPYHCCSTPDPTVHVKTSISFFDLSRCSYVGLCFNEFLFHFMNQDSILSCQITPLTFSMSYLESPVFWNLDDTLSAHRRAK